MHLQSQLVNLLGEPDISQSPARRRNAHHRHLIRHQTARPHLHEQPDGVDCVPSLREPVDHRVPAPDPPLRIFIEHFAGAREHARLRVQADDPALGEAVASEAVLEAEAVELAAEGGGVHVAGGLEGEGEGVGVRADPAEAHVGEEGEGGPRVGVAEVAADEGVPVERGDEEVEAEEAGVDLGAESRVRARVKLGG